MKKILLVNPYIEDFAAYDHFSKPLGLLMLAGMLRGKFELSFANALDRLHTPGNLRSRPDGTGEFPHARIPKPAAVANVPRYFKRYGVPEDVFASKLLSGPRPDWVFVTSGMTYWYTGLDYTVRLIRRTFPGVPVALGGIYASLMPEHALAAVRPDFLVRGQDPSTVLAGVSEITGVPLEVPPFVEPAYDLLGEYAYLPVLTSLGCVFACKYCASGRLCGYRRFDPQETAAMILRIGRDYGVKNFAFYDDALLYDSPRHIDVILEEIVKDEPGLRFYTPNGLHVKFLTAATASLMKKAGFADVRLSLESADDGFHASEDLKTDFGEFREAVGMLRAAGFEREQIQVYTLVNLPGSNAGAALETMKRIDETGAVPRLAYYSPIPGTPDFERAARTAGLSDPLSHNNTVHFYRAGIPAAKLHELKMFEITCRRK